MFALKPLRAAAFNGHSKVVACLLQYDVVDPSTLQSWALRKAAENGHLDTVIELLRDGRSDATSHSDYALTYSAMYPQRPLHRFIINISHLYTSVSGRYGHSEVVMALLNHPTSGVSASARNGSIIGHACANGDLVLVNYLLARTDVDPSERRNYAFVCLPSSFPYTENDMLICRFMPRQMDI